MHRQNSVVTCLSGIALLLACAGAALAAEPPQSAAKPAEPRYDMTVYWMGFLKKGPAWTPEPTPEVMKLQEGHLANIRRMAELGKLVVAGPLDKAGDFRGILIFAGGDEAEIRTLVDADPAVQARRLVLELYPWYAAKGLKVDPPLPPEVPADPRYVNLPTRPIQAPFSDAVWTGDTLWIAGRLGLDPATGLPPADPKQEARLALDGIRSVLEAAGLAMKDLASVTVYCPDVKLYDAFNEVYRGYFTGPFPARAFVGSGPLLKGARFEIQAVASRPEAR